MPGLWVQISTDLKDHPKLARCARLLREDRCTTAGRLVFLWSWLLKFSSDGRIENSAELIAEITDWHGNPDEIMNALLNCGDFGKPPGFLELDAEMSEYVRAHDWAQYSGKLRIAADKNAERQKKHREIKRNGYVTVTSQLQETLRNKKVTGEIEIEKEIENREINPWVESQMRVILATVKNPAPDNLRELLQTWADSYGEEQVANCVKQSLHWMINNGKRYRNMGRFIGGWVARNNAVRPSEVKRGETPMSAREIFPELVKALKNQGDEVS